MTAETVPTQVPPELADEWQRVNDELGEASRELHEANKRYYAALFARIAIVSTIRGRQQR